MTGYVALSFKAAHVNSGGGAVAPVKSVVGFSWTLTNFKTNAQGTTAAKPDRPNSRYVAPVLTVFCRDKPGHLGSTAPKRRRILMPESPFANAPALTTAQP